MKSLNNVPSRSCDENSQLDSDVSNNSSSGNIHDSVISTSHAEADHQMPSLTVVAGKDHVGGNNNDQPASLDLTINAPVQPFLSFCMSRAFASFDGIGVHSGVPTRTTPTLTPTTLKNIEQTFIEATNATQINLPYQAGFVPPSYPMEDHSQDGGVSQESLSSTSNGSWHVSGSHGFTGDDLDSKSSASMDQPSFGTRASRSTFATSNSDDNVKLETGLLDAVNSFAIGTTTRRTSGPSARNGSGGRRNVGGRRPHKPSNLTPEEEEKRRIRRERNKQAAARCRRRREDHTNELVDETDQLEKKRQSLAQEIQQLQQEKDDLEFLLESHRAHCRLQARHSPIDLKPTELENIATFVLPKIKTEPDEEFILQRQNLRATQMQDHLDNDASEHSTVSKKLKISNTHTESLETPTPTSSGFIPLVGVSFAGTKPSSEASGSRPTRPDSLDVKSAAQYPLIARIDAGGPVGMSTPSSGLFNFDSLMEGGTGLTPIAAPISFPSNRNPLELITPTSTEPSKLCSL
ncbi:transcription factor kayak isoform X1 [Anopheles arabiensis]|uniref:transcription factor kayak isoform X1 n=1 Tax=Anopheles arabiensis TaxID=7173 RepID=UPI001AACB569|nr:transcription factor kayak isoform X1 [Anopheles arabiensis]XP_040172632.1 transcription factor kayak isoform X1 [Anopheles arabiensis]